MPLLGLHIADVFVLGLYLIGITIIGIWAARRIKKRRRFLYAPQIRQSNDDNARFSPVKLLSGILVRTHIKPGEQVPAPCTLPADAVVPEFRNIHPIVCLGGRVPGWLGMRRRDYLLGLFDSKGVMYRV